MGRSSRKERKVPVGTWSPQMLGVLAYSFAVCLENVIVFPAMWPRIQTFPGLSDHDRHWWLGVCMAAFSFGRAVAATAVNYREHTRSSLRAVGTVCFILSVAGCVMYIIAKNVLVLAASRVVAGLGAGALSLMIATLVALSTEKGRTQALSRFYIAAAVGEVAGPAIAAATSHLSFKLPVLDVTVDGLNNAGLWALVLFVGAFVLVFRAFEAAPEAAPDTTPLSMSLINVPMILALLSVLVTNIAVASWETIILPMAQYYFHWGLTANGLLFMASGGVLFVCNIFLVDSAKARGVSDVLGSACSIALAIAGGIVLVAKPDSIAGFATGNVLFTMGIFNLLTYSTSLYTQTPRARQGFFVGIMRSGSALARVAGNLVAAQTLHAYGTGGPGVTTPEMYLLGLPCLLVLLLALFVWRWRKTEAVDHSASLSTRGLSTDSAAVTKVASLQREASSGSFALMYGEYGSGRSAYSAVRPGSIEATSSANMPQLTPTQEGTDDEASDTAAIYQSRLYESTPALTDESAQNGLYGTL